jgi:hypothetical protein
MSYSTVSQTGDTLFTHSDINNVNPIFAKYAVTKTIPILTKCDDYYCSIIQFSIPLSSIPLYIFPVTPGSLLTRVSPMVIGITVGGINYAFNLIYEPDNNYTPVNQTNPKMQIITQYYFCYSYQNMINSINVALSQAYVAAGLSTSGNSYPYFFYNDVTGLINLVVDQRDFSPTATPSNPTPIPNAVIFLNEYLQFFLSAIPYKFTVDTVLGDIYNLNLIVFGTYNLQSSSSTPTYTNNQKIFSQEYSTVATWNALKKILVTTSTIPIISEYTPTNNSGISSTLPVLTDFIPFIEFPGQSRSTAYFTPTTQYRLVDLVSSERLNTIDLNIYWQDIYQNIYPLTLTIFQQASIKLGFFKKSLYKSSTPLLKK